MFWLLAVKGVDGGRGDVGKAGVPAPDGPGALFTRGMIGRAAAAASMPPPWGTGGKGKRVRGLGGPQVQVHSGGGKVGLERVHVVRPICKEREAQREAERAGDWGWWWRLQESLLSPVFCSLWLGGPAANQIRRSGSRGKVKEGREGKGTTRPTTTSVLGPPTPLHAPSLAHTRAHHAPWFPRPEPRQGGRMTGTGWIGGRGCACWTGQGRARDRDLCAEVGGRAGWMDAVVPWGHLSHAHTLVPFGAVEYCYFRKRGGSS